MVDLFCGVGGLTCGLKKSGLNVVAGLDNDSTCEFAYTENNNTKFICADVSEYPSVMKNLHKLNYHVLNALKRDFYRVL